MIEPPVPVDEARRLSVLHALDILDTLEETQFDAATALAASLCDTPIALVSLVDADRQWFKSAFGMAHLGRQTPRSWSLCAHAIVEDALMVVNDAARDARFCDSPLVTGPPHLRFYAGVPLRVDDCLLGTLCVIDSRPRDLSTEQALALMRLAEMVERLFAERGLRNRIRVLQEQQHRELELGREVLENLCGSRDPLSPGVEVATLAAGAFSGDVVKVVRTDGGVIVAMLADISGHDLSAALYQVPALEVFARMTDARASVGAIARALNSRSRTMLRTGHFMAATVVAVDPAARTLSVWNGGMPDALLLLPSGDVAHRFVSRHLALGVVGDDAFDDSVETVTTGAGDFVAFSDGLVEAEGPGGEQFGVARILESLRRGPRAGRASRLVETVRLFASVAGAGDDMSLLSIALDELSDPEVVAPGRSQGLASGSTT